MGWGELIRNMISCGCFRQISLVEELEKGERNHWEARESGMCKAVRLRTRKGSEIPWISGKESKGFGGRVEGKGSLG